MTRGSTSRPPAKKQLGQHFLVDENILGVIGRLAELEPRDVVLEVGPGLGVLAEARGDDRDELERVIEANATAAFRLP